MLIVPIRDDRRLGLSRVPSHSGQVANVTARSTKARMCGCIASTSLARNDFWIEGMIPVYVRLIPSTLILVGSLWSRSCSSRLVYWRIGLSGSKIAAAAEDPAVPAVHAVAGDGQRALVERLAVVVERCQVDVGDRAPTLAARAHAAGDAEAAAFLDRLAGPAGGDRTGAADRGHVEGERLRGTDVRRPQPAEQDPQHRVGVGGGADRGPRVGTHPLLVDDDRGRQSLQHVHVRPGQRRHEALHEGAVGLVDQPLRLGSDGAEDQRALARAGHPGEHGEPPLGDLDADVLEVVDPGARAPGSRRGRGSRARCPRAGGPRPRAGSRQRPSAAGAADCWIRIMLPAGSRTAQSRTPYGWSIGSWTTSTPLACSRSKVAARSAVARMRPA